MDQVEIIVTVYSTFKHILQPDNFRLPTGSRCHVLVSTYLSKHRLLEIDPNLISARIIKLNENNRSVPIETIELGIDLKPHHLIADQNCVYHLTLERGISVIVNLNFDKKGKISRNITISPVTTAFQLFHLAMTDIPVNRINAVFNVHHESGNLKPSDLPVLVFQKTGSNEFHVGPHQISENEAGILWQLKTHSEEIISETNSSILSKFDNNLSKVLYYNSERTKQRRLPQLSKSFTRERKIYDFEKIISDGHIEKTNKRSLPKTPLSSNEIYVNQIPSAFNVEINTGKKGTTILPDPIIKTNAVTDEVHSILSSQSSNCESEKDFSSTDDTSRDSVILRIQSAKSDFCSPNLYHLVKYCNLVAVDLSIKSNGTRPFPIELKESYFQGLMTSTNNRPLGPTPLLGRDNSAFVAVEKNQEKRKLLVVEIGHIHEIDINFCNNNINIGDILVNIDDEDILSKSKEFIYSKLTKNVKHEIILARYKHLTEDNKAKEKDQNIEELKIELDILKRKYHKLHSLTNDNNAIIRQLNEKLKNQRLAAP